jgi:hypothetical protein
MQKFFALVLATAALTRISAEPLIPTADGMTWLYEMTEKAGPDLSFGGRSQGARTIHRLATYRINGTQDLNARTLWKFEMLRDGVITNTDLMIVNEHGMFCAGRIDQFGKVTALDPPQTMVASPLQPGTAWDFVTTLAGSKVRQRYEVVGSEDVDVPAGDFRAVHIHGEQTEPIPMTIDRWFATGTGIVKDVTTTKTPEGELVRRISLELKEPPKIAARPNVKPLSAPKKISLQVASTPTGDPTDQFSADIPKIYARWQGHDLPTQAKIRLMWVAENVAEVAPPDYVVDEASTLATDPDAHGTFTLSRPEGGWASGEYRLDAYLGAELIDSVRIKIAE